MPKVMIGSLDQLPDQPAPGQPMIARVPLLFYDLPTGATDRSEIEVEVTNTDTNASLKSKVVAAVQAKAASLGVTLSGSDVIRLWS